LGVFGPPARFRFLIFFLGASVVIVVGVTTIAAAAASSSSFVSATSAAMPAHIFFFPFIGNVLCCAAKKTKTQKNKETKMNSVPSAHGPHAQKYFAAPTWSDGRRKKKSHTRTHTQLCAARKILSVGKVFLKTDNRRLCASA
jgi:hypothetical protein